MSAGMDRSAVFLSFFCKAVGWCTTTVKRGFLFFTVCSAHLNRSKHQIWTISARRAQRRLVDDKVYYRSDKPDLVSAEVNVNLIEKVIIAICLVKRMKPCVLLRTG